MPQVKVKNFKYGLDLRREEIAAQLGTLRQLTNAFVNQGGEIEQRKAFVKQTGRLEFGLENTDSGLVTFGSRASSQATTHRARASNVATLTIGTHLFVVGDLVTVTGLGGTGYNQSNVTITAIAATTISYANTGSDEGTTADTAGTVALALPSGVTYQRLQHPAVTEGATYDATYHKMTRVMSTNHRGKAFAAAKFTDDNWFFFYDGTLVDQTRSGLVLAGRTSLSAQADDFAARVNDIDGWTATAFNFVGGVAPPDYQVTTASPYPIGFVQIPETDTAAGKLGVWNENTNATPGTAGTKAIAKFQITATGVSGDTLTVEAPAQSSAATPLVTLAVADGGVALASTMANYVRLLINNYTNVHGYYATVSGSTVFVYAPIGWVMFTFNLTVTVTGGITVAASAVAEGLTATISQTSIQKNATGNLSTVIVVSSTVTVSPNGGTGPYTYLWEDVGASPSGITITNSTGAATSFSAELTDDTVLGEPQSISGKFRCKVTDAVAAVTYTDVVSVTLVYNRTRVSLREVL